MVLIVSMFYLGNIVEVADEMHRSLPFACFDPPAADLFNEADIIPLMAPCLIHGGGIKGHARQPNSVLQLIGSDEPFSNLCVAAAVKKLRVGREILMKRVLGNYTMVTQIDLLKDVSAMMFDMTRHVHSHKDTC